MSDVSVVFFDVGGVLLTNGWDRAARRSAIDNFDLDWEEFEDRHQYVAAEFETGDLELESYLERTVFYRDREFTRGEFTSFMESRSQALDESLDVVEAVARSGRVTMATLNNESRELNRYRIETFGLRRFFSVFLSSCFVGLRKPDEDIYRLAVEVMHAEPERCAFVDDRPLNLECADQLGIRTIHFTGAGALRESLAGIGVLA